jgi:hypothetical protein
LKLNILLNLFSLLFLAAPAMAISRCYDESLYPVVYKLKPTENGFIAHLRGMFLSQEDGRDPHYEWPTVAYTPEGKWKKGDTASCQGRDCFWVSEDLDVDIPLPSLSRREAIALRPELESDEEIEQKVSAWTDYQGIRWFGIGFYSGEGTSGVGGVGRYDPKIKRLEIRRPLLLRDASVQPILYDGKSLWLGTYGSYECGVPHAHGLVRYEWDTEQVESFEGRNEGPCGFMVKDLLQQGDFIWVATELGLSRWDRKKQRWDHFIPDPNASPPMRQTVCSALYMDLLKTLPKQPVPEADIEGYYHQLYDTLATFHPDFIRQYIKARPAAEWECIDIKFLARQAMDFKTLQEEILSIRPVKEKEIRCLLYGFRDQGKGDPAWRDFLLSIFEMPGDENRSLRRDALDRLEAFPGDEKVAEALTRRIEAEPNPWPEVELLPVVMGKKGLPLLISLLDRFKNDLKMLSSIGGAIQDVTQHYWDPELGIQSLPEKKDDSFITLTPTERFIADWKSWWEAEQSKNIRK